MRDKIIYGFFTAISLIVLCTILYYVGVSKGMFKENPYANVSRVVILGESNYPAMGDVLILSVDGTTSVPVQREKCINMEQLKTGDEFTAVEVIDSCGELQCIVKVK